MSAKTIESQDPKEIEETTEIDKIEEIEEIEEKEETEEKGEREEIEKKEKVEEIEEIEERGGRDTTERTEETERRDLNALKEETKSADIGTPDMATIDRTTTQKTADVMLPEDNTIATSTERTELKDRENIDLAASMRRREKKTEVIESL